MILKIISFFMLFQLGVFAQNVLGIPEDKNVASPKYEKVDIKFQSPKELVLSFLSAANEIKSGNKKGYLEAQETLDLSFVDKAMRNSIARLTIDRLIVTIDKLGGMKLQSVPDYKKGARWYFRKEIVEVQNKTFDVEISIDYVENQGWLFTKETIQSIENFSESLAHIDLKESLHHLSLQSKLLKWFPPWMGEEVFLMKNIQWFGLGVIFLLGLVAFVLVRFLLSRYLRRIWKQDETIQSDEEENSSTLPFGILAFALNWIFTLRFLDLHLETFSYLMRAGYIMTAISTVWVGLKIVDILSIHFEKMAEQTDNKFDDVLVPMLKKASKVMVVSFGAVFVLHSLTFDVGNILAGLGIGGVAVALAAKDTISNLFGSVTVLIDRPFQIGDYVVLEKNIEGIVEEVGFRSTRIRTPHNSLVSIPNANLAIGHIDNYGARVMRRYKVILGLEYSTTPEKCEEFCERLRYLIKLNPKIRQDNFQVGLTDLGQSSIQVLLSVFFEGNDPMLELEEKHKLLLEILLMAKEINVSFAYPTQTIFHKNLEG